MEELISQTFEVYTKDFRKVMPLIFSRKYSFLNRKNYKLMNFALNPCSIFPQSLRPLLRPCADEEQVCACLTSTMHLPAYVANFLLGESHRRQCVT